MVSDYSYMDTNENGLVLYILPLMVTGPMSFLFVCRVSLNKTVPLLSAIYFIYPGEDMSWFASLMSG